MSRESSFLVCCVKLLTRCLTLCCLVLSAGCAYLERHIAESCKTHAYIRLGVSDYITQRFHSQAPVRLGIVPFTVPANLATTSSEHPGLDLQLTTLLHGALLEYQEIPIVEILPRNDWPGKKDEFFTGNHTAIRLAREAGYDLVLVGYVEPLRSTTDLTTYAKILDTDSGVTVWYGRIKVSTRRKDLYDAQSSVGLTDDRTDMIYSRALIEESARCIAKGAMNQDGK